MVPTANFNPFDSIKTKIMCAMTVVAREDAAHTHTCDERFRNMPAIQTWSMDPACINDGHELPEDVRPASDNKSASLSVETPRASILAYRDRVGCVR